MTGARFNLLPARYVERVAERRWARLIALALVVVLGALVLSGLTQARTLRAAKRERDVEQVRIAALVVRSGQLVRFRQLADAVTGRERLLAAAMGTEVSWAGVLTSLAQSFPADASLTSVTAESTLLAFSAVPPVMPGDVTSVIGSTALKGYSVESFTPGVERLLQLLATVTGLSEPRLRLGAVEEMGQRAVTTFEGSAFVDATALSRRYAQGLPAQDDIAIPVMSGGRPATTTPPAAERAAPR